MHGGPSYVFNFLLDATPFRKISLFCYPLLNHAYIPYVSNLVGTNPPTINADYVAFIEGAEANKENILHVILENGDEGNEKARVQARLKLGVYHKNFYPIALRLDGKFFERHDLDKNSKCSETMEEPLEGLKNRFRAKLLSDLGDFEEEDMTASTLHTNQVETQLEENGFCVPQKVRNESNLEMHIGSLLDEVQNIYFSGVQNITTVEQHQAFLILSYVHIILFLCWEMKISILEALCKDDKDRGNVIKTILKLHFLYITGQIKHDTLAAVLTHMLARPFIVQKGPIIPSRLKLLQRTIPVMKAARERTPVPSTKVVFGQETIHDPSYTVTKPPGQTIHPNNATSRTVEEYQAFLENHQPVPIPPHTGNLIPALGQNREGVDKASFAFLHGRCGRPEEKALSASCSFQVLYTHLNGIFENHSLGISVRLKKFGCAE
jgi:hypothetical protein